MKTINMILCLLVLPMIIAAQEVGKDAVVAPVKMNVMYRGMSNPIEIAVPGVTSDKVSASVANGTIKKVANGWEVSPGDQGEVVVTVLVNNKKVSEKNFRVKNVPLPVAVFAGKHEGTITKENALKTEAIDVELKDFDWDLKFTVKSFVLLYSDEKGDYEELSNVNKINDKMKSMISKCKAGQNIIFKDIKSIGPDGRSRDLDPIVLKIN